MIGAVIDFVRSWFLYLVILAVAIYFGHQQYIIYDTKQQAQAYLLQQGKLTTTDLENDVKKDFIKNKRGAIAVHVRWEYVKSLIGEDAEEARRSRPREYTVYFNRDRKPYRIRAITPEK
jgi:hypothetical protein